jgi:hypothetical protein
MGDDGGGGGEVTQEKKKKKKTQTRTGQAPLLPATGDSRTVK